MLPSYRTVLLALCCTVFSLPIFAQQRAELSIGMHRIDSEVAATPGTRQTGLMNRQHMATQNGMIFIFREANTHCMWMKNTPLPLSVAFIDDEGYIINIADMQPLSEQSHCAKHAARYALEMNQGWFAQRGIEPGQQVRGLQKLPAPQ